MLRLIVFLWALASVHICAQQERVSLAVDASVGVGIQAPLGSFGSIPGVASPESVLFSPSTASIGWWFHVGADIPLLENIRVGARLGARSLAMSYTATERVPIATEQGQVFFATLQHSLTSDVVMFLAEPRVRYEPFSWLAIAVGIPLWFPISDNYTQTQRFIDPTGLSFVDGSTEQMTSQGAIPNRAAIVTGIEAHLEGLLPLTTTRNLFLVPHVGYSRVLTSVNIDGALQSQSFTFGVGFRYLFGIQENNPIETTPQQVRLLSIERDTTVDLSTQVKEAITSLTSTRSDSIIDGNVVRIRVRESYRTLLPKPPSVLRGSLRLAFMHDDGSVSDDAQLYAQRVRLSRTVPMMPLVIFDDSSSVLPARYVQFSSSRAASWKEPSALTDANVHWQYHVLNVIGFRLKVNPSASCTLLAYDDGTEFGKGLALRRIESVQRYLMQSFGIASRRINVEVRKGQPSPLPWVMIVDPTRRLIRPVASSFVQNETRLPRVRIMPDVVSEAGMNKWSITMFQAGRSVRTYADTGAVPAMILWNMNENLNADAVLLQQILVELRLEDTEGTSTRSEPGRIAMRSQSVTDVSGVPSSRVEILRLHPPDYLSTPESELFSGAGPFTSIEFYPETETDEAEFLQSDAPVYTKPLNAAAWFRRGLVGPEKELYQRAEVYIKEERQP